jgi:hypothetical protein
MNNTSQTMGISNYPLGSGDVSRKTPSFSSVFSACVGVEEPYTPMPIDTFLERAVFLIPPSLVILVAVQSLGSGWFLRYSIISVSIPWNNARLLPPLTKKTFKQIGL